MAEVQKKTHPSSVSWVPRPHAIFFFSLPLDGLLLGDSRTGPDGPHQEGREKKKRAIREERSLAGKQSLAPCVCCVLLFPCFLTNAIKCHHVDHGPWVFG